MLRQNKIWKNAYYRAPNLFLLLPFHSAKPVFILFSPRYCHISFYDFSHSLHSHNNISRVIAFYLHFLDYSSSCCLFVVVSVLFTVIAGMLLSLFHSHSCHQSPLPLLNTRSSCTHHCPVLLCHHLQRATLMSAGNEPNAALMSWMVDLPGGQLRGLLLRSQDPPRRPRRSTSPSSTASTRQWRGNWCQRAALAPTWTILRSCRAAWSRAKRH